MSELSGALASRVPSKIDIGPIYTCDPRERAKYMKGKPMCSISLSAVLVRGDHCTALWAMQDPSMTPTSVVGLWGVGGVGGISRT